MWPVFLNFASIISLINTEEYECMHDILRPKGMGSKSRDLVIFWEISVDISETVQDRDIVAMES